MASVLAKNGSPKALTGSDLHEGRERLNIVRESARDFLEREWSIAKFREVMEAKDGYSTSLWKKIRELGWPGTLVPEAEGGSGGNYLELAGILDECGAALAPSPLCGNAIALQLVLGSSNAKLKTELVPGACEGGKPLAIALREQALTTDRTRVALVAKSDGAGFVLEGTKLFVPFANAASSFLVVAKLEDGTRAILSVPANANGVEVKRLLPLDFTSTQEVTFASVKLGADRLLATGDEADRLLREALLQGDVLVCAEIAGNADSALALAVQYAKDRVAFERPIGQFQGIKHKLVNIRADIEVARALLRNATMDIAMEHPKRRVSAAQTAFWAIDALKKVPEGCLQVFGGIGFTWEHDIHLYLRRSATLASQLGEKAEYREIVADYIDKGTV